MKFYLNREAQKTHENFFHHNLKKSDPILISFGVTVDLGLYCRRYSTRS